MYSKTLDFFNGDDMAAGVFMNKYSHNQNETPQDVCQRLTNEFSRIEKNYSMIDITSDKYENLSEYGKERYKIKDWKNHIYSFLGDFKYIISGGSGLEGIGTDKNGSYSNCYKNTDPKDNINSIIESAKEIANIAKRRGGTSVDVSNLRPKGSEIHNASRESTGVVSWMRIYNAVSQEIGQHGRQSGTLISLHVEHPDVLDFIKCKKDKKELTNTNISLKFSKEFLDAVADNKDFLLRFPIDLDITNVNYEELKYNVLTSYENSSSKYIKKVKAKEIWNEYCISNHECGDPGCLFWDNLLENDGSSVYPELKPKSVNLCVTGDTEILTKYGYEKIKDCVSKRIEIWNGFEWSEVIPFKTSDSEKIYNVKLSDGSSIKCTDYHKFILKDNERVEVKDLKIGYKLSKFDYPLIEYGNNLDYTDKEWYTQGFYSGDGFYNKKDKQCDIELYGEKIKLHEYLSGQLIGNYDIVDDSHRFRINNIINKNKIYVPKNIDIKSRLSWLSGIIDSDGTLNDISGSISISSIDRDFLYEIKTMLITLGIKSVLGINKPEQIKEIKGKEYLCQTCYCLTISTFNTKKLINIGLNTHRVPLVANPNRDAAHFITVVDIIEQEFKESVYCLTDPKNNSCVFNHVMTAQCGELPLAELQSCILVAANLYNLIDNPFIKNKSKLNNEQAYKVFYETICIGDDYVDLEIEQLNKILTKIEPNINTSITAKQYKIDCINNDKEIDEEYITWLNVKDKLIKGRKIGCGFLGLGDMYAALYLPYGDKDITEELMKIKLRAELDATIDLAIIRGSFELYDSNKEYLGEYKKPQNSWYKFLLDNFQSQVIKMISCGRRNVTWSCIAPTGTLGIITQSTSGIEPLFAPYYKRRVKVFKEGEPYDYIDVDGQKFKESFVVHQKLHEYIKVSDFSLDKSENDFKDEDWEKVYESSPYNKQIANDLKIDIRTQTQSIINKYICSSISSTVNLPNNATVEDMSNVYNSAYRNGCKGITCYRDGSKGGVLITDDNKDEDCKEFYERHIPKLPKELKGDFHKIKYKGETYVIIIGIHPKCDFPVELFCFKPTLDNIDEKIPFKNIPEHNGKRIKVKKGLYAFESDYIKIPDLGAYNSKEEKQLSINISLMMRQGTPKQYIIDTIKRFDGDISSFSSVVSRVLSKYVKDSELKEELCPDCGLKLINENGCKHCTCGYSACS